MSQLPKVIDVPGRVVQQAGGGLEGAERTSRETAMWDVAVISPDRQMAYGAKEQADARGLSMVQNDPYVTGAVATHRDSIVGSQYRVNAQPDFEVLGATEEWAEKFQLLTEGRFNLIADSNECWLDASGMNTFTGMVRLAVGGFLFGGEVLATAEWKRESGRPFKTAIQMVSPTRLSNPDALPDTSTLRRGVVKDTFGAPQSYWIRTTHPGDLFYDAYAPFTWVNVPIRKPWGRLQVLHIIEQMQPDQTRGLADLVSGLKGMRMTQKFQDVTLQNAVLQASYAAAIESELPPEVVAAQMGAGKNATFEEVAQGYMTALSSYVNAGGTVKMDGVKIPHLFPGTKLNMRPVVAPGGVGSQFETSLLRHTAAALGISYEEFSKDYSKTNYSSFRAAAGASWKFMQSRKKLVADRFAKSVYVLWLEEQLNDPASPIKLPPHLTMADYYRDPMIREAIGQCSFLGAARGQIDEMKETQAAILRISNGLSTIEDEAGALGKDWRKLLRQLSREKKFLKELGLELGTTDASKPGANQRQEVVRGRNGGDDDSSEDDDDGSL